MDKLKLVEAIKELIEKGDIKAYWENHETDIIDVSINNDGKLVLSVDDF